LLRKDSSFSGRTLLWAAVVQEIADRPWLGYGLQAFWNGRTAEFSQVWAIVRWAPPHSHNGFLDLALNIGIIGTGLFLIGFVLSAGRALTNAYGRVGDRLAYWPLTFLAYFTLTNISESTLLRHSSIFWILYVSVVCRLGRSGAESPHSPAAVSQGAACT
ncbi:MAG: O-antigen ligase family protein, partial [Gemmatimonadales bacterium]